MNTDNRIIELALELDCQDAVAARLREPRSEYVANVDLDDRARVRELAQRNVARRLSLLNAD